MANLRHRLSLIAVLLGAATPAAGHFDELRSGIERGNPQAFKEVLRLSNVTLPGEKLEDLAELASIFVRANPEAFLRLQGGDVNCFGVDFMGARFVDNSAARERETRLRIAALRSVSDPSLAKPRRLCLARLGK
jgi:hypothetical protein